MKTKRTSTITTTERARPRIRLLASYLCFGVLFSLLVASALYTASSASSNNKAANAADSAKQVIHKDTATETRSKSFATMWLPPFVPPTPLVLNTIGTFEATAGACTNNPKTSFLLGEEVCVKASAELVGRRLSVAGTDGTVADIVDVTTDPQELVFTLPNTTTSVVNGLVVDNRGIWRATVHSSADFGTRANSFFSVSDPANAAADLIIFADSTATDTVTPGSATGFKVVLQNAGPDPAAEVHVTQSVPANMTFDSVTAGTGIAFTCTESEGLVDCEPSGNLASGATSTFTLNYTVSAGAPNAIVTTEIDIASATTDPNPDSNSALATLEIRAAGSSPPTCVLSCPLNMTVGANTTQSGQPGAIVNFEADPSGDCGTVTSSPTSGSFFSVSGSPHTVSVSSSTGGGSCSFTITVTEVAAPTITCAADQTATTSGSSNEASVTVNTPTATGQNVQVTGVRNDNRSLSDGYPVGTTTITWTARECNNPPDCDDPNARFATCTQRIIVTSPDAPTISCPSNKTFTTADCSGGRTLTSAEIGSPTATGTNVTVAGERSDGLHLTNDPYPIGTTAITWTATDDGGRQASCTQLITITAGNDTTPPTITAPPNVNTTTNSCSQIVGESELGTPTASDDCGTPNVSRTGVPPGNVFPTGTTTITYTATDSAGNTATATQTVTVTESPAINPTITAPGDVTVNTGPGATSCGAFVGDATLGNATASDNCPGVTVTRTGVPAGNIFPVGTTTVTYTATDRSGNTAQDTQDVTVIDNTPPVVTPPAAVTLFTGPGANSCGVTVTDLDGTLGTGSATDNCPGVQNPPSRSGVPSGNFFPVGQTTLTYSVTDAHGNSASAQQVVTVVDNTAPVISCPANIVLEPTCPSGAIATFADATATDNCGVQSVVRTAGPASGSVFPIGTTTVTYTATDIHNNTSSCSFTVTVKTVVQTIDDLKAAVTANTQLNAPQRNGLISKLDAARQHFLNGNQNGACAKLADFINSVQNFITNGTLSAATGNAWISTAANLRNTIGCTNNPCT